MRGPSGGGWPPRWIALDPMKDDKPDGEVGGLEGVDMHHFIGNRLFLFMRWQGFDYFGVITLANRAFCRQIHGLPLHQIGKKSAI